MEIRRLTYADLPQVIAIERRSYRTPWSLAMFVLELSKPSGVCLAAERDGAIVGYLVCSRYDQVWHVMNVSVNPDLRRAGHRDRADDRALRPHRRRRRRASRSRSGRPTTARDQRSTRGSASPPPGAAPRYYQDNGEDAVIMWRTPATLVGRLDDIPNVGVG